MRTEFGVRCSGAEPVIYELGKPGRVATTLPALDVPEAAPLPAQLLRDGVDLPEVSELDLVRHYVRLSQLNWAIDIGFYPLGSCTMKYNPKVNEAAARLPGFAQTHPYQPEHTVQGNLLLMFELQEMLKEIGGFAGVTLQPCAGAQGELSGVLMMRAYQLDRGENQRTRIIVPDAAHGTNPATTTMSGLQVVEAPSDERGNVDLEALRAICDDTVCGMMLTNPNTLGLFDEHLPAIVDLVHGCGGLMYGDGANMNAIMGIVRPGDLGFDVMHFNLHKTFSTPHGGGGPGAGPVGVCEKLVDFLPGPLVAMCHHSEDACGCGCEDEECAEESVSFHLVMPEKSIGRVKAFYGNFGVLVRAYAYIRTLGAAGLRAASEMAVLNANYLKARMQGILPISHDRTHMHEFVAMGIIDGAPDIKALDISKRLIDYGFHPSSNYFPLIVHEALMIEPTETESKETLDAFAEAMAAIRQEALTDPELLRTAPHSAPLRRLDEVRAAREPVLRWKG
ncbi:MAG TPA: aminomethyl-transferring glycine dehydrogenase subunit GcvPB [Anaerolineae bacterium]|nr:aminomethyl-transferring glycine dehydrogenase subunit GcvPB [Anaerolineae bacterium]